MFTYPAVRQCFAIAALLSGFVPKSATFSSLLTLCTRNLCDVILSCTHKYATSMCFSFPIPCLWRMCSPLHQRSTLASLQSPSRASCFGLPLLPTLPMLLHRCNCDKCLWTGFYCAGVKCTCRFTHSRTTVKNTSQTQDTDTKNKQ